MLEVEDWVQKSRPATQHRKGLSEMPLSESRIRANRKYNEKAYDRIELKVAKGKKAELQTHAAAREESLNGFVNRAIDNQVQRDEAKDGE
jgi:predicted HicB family RNase H-like nuclease